MVIDLWVDVLTPKQVLFFYRLIKDYEGEGLKVWVTTRHYREALQQLRLKNLRATVIGKHGETLEEKLVSSIERILILTRFLKKMRVKGAISFSSPEAARAAFGLGIPHACVSDSPHAKAVSKLTIPLSCLLFTPKMIPKEEFTYFGIAPEDIVQYDALDPVAWLKYFNPDPAILSQVGIKEQKEDFIVVIRAEESHAAYLSNIEEGLTLKIVSELIKTCSKRSLKCQIIVMPRYEDYKMFKEKIGKKAIILSRNIDAASLLLKTDLFIGGGGTMNAEAALLGVPTISYFPRETTTVEKYLIEEGLIARSKDPQKVVEKSVEALLNQEEWKRKQRKGKELLKRMEDPIKVIKDHLKPIIEK